VHPFDLIQQHNYDLVCVSKASIEEQKQAIAELETRYKDMKSRTGTVRCNLTPKVPEMEVKLKMLHFEELLKKQQVESDNARQEEGARYEELNKLKVAQELQANEALQFLQREHQNQKKVRLILPTAAHF
jgi:ribonuclease BN (tRNA processing enzyme)